MGRNILDFFIRAKDQTGPGTKQAQSNFKKMAMGIGRRLVAMVAIIATVRAAFKGFVSAIKSAMQLESMKNPFIRFVGSAKEARKHLEELRDVAKFGIFGHRELIDASRNLMNLSSGLLGSAKDMKALADVAATTGNNIDQVSNEVSRFLQYLKQGRDVTRGSMGLEKLGIISTEASMKIKGLVDAGGDMIDIWKVVTAEVNKFSGGLEDDAALAESSIGRIKTAWQELKDKFGSEFIDVFSKAIDRFSDVIHNLIEGGGLQRLGEMLGGVANSVINITDKISRAADRRAFRKKLVEDGGQSKEDLLKNPKLFNELYDAEVKQRQIKRAWQDKKEDADKPPLSGADDDLRIQQLVKDPQRLLNELAKARKNRSTYEKEFETGDKGEFASTILNQKYKAVEDLEKHEKAAIAALKKLEIDKLKKVKEEELKNANSDYAEKKNNIEKLSSADDARSRKSIAGLEKEISTLSQQADYYEQMAGDKDFREGEEVNIEKAAKVHKKYLKILEKAEGKPYDKLSDVEKYAVDSAKARGQITKDEQELAAQNKAIADNTASTAASLKSLDTWLKTALQTSE